MRTLEITAEMEATARQVLGFPHLRPGNTVPPFMRRQYRLLEFVRLMADAVLGTTTPPIVLEQEQPAVVELPPSCFEMGPHPKMAPYQKDYATRPLTRPQLDALARMPADWFSSEALSHAIHAADGMCQRLVKKGVLEQRSACPPGTDFVQWTQRTAHTRYYQYRKVPAETPA